ncbi:MAG: sulfite exporter TauE/SafE family protein [Lachnospiraceae bacterium]|nr:sulfite exporter TauE/SafE family protein [Lachnospiraceae bacterium]
MDIAMVLPAFTAAVTVGLGCGTCCSPVISVFLSTYVVSHANSVKKGILSFVSFFFGKLVSVSFLCAASAAISRQFIDSDGYIGSFNLRFAAQAGMSVIGIVLAVKWMIKNAYPEKKCESCTSPCRLNGKAGFWPMFTAGITYGFTPCAPLLLMIGYSITLPVAFAGAMGVVFSLSSMASPVLLLAMITGALSKRMTKELPQQVKWFQLASYLLLIIMPFVFTTKY